MREHGAHRSRELGQAVMLVMAVVAVVAAMMVGLAAFGVRVSARAQAQAAADAAALAAVGALDTDGVAAAASLARRNGARLISYSRQGDDVLVVVELRGERATARATRAP